MTTQRARIPQPVKVFAVGLLCIAAAGATLAWGWGSGTTVKGDGAVRSEMRSLGAFDGISVADDFVVQVRQGSSNTVEVKTDSNLQPLLETRVVTQGAKRVLEIAAKKDYSLSGSVRPMINVEMPQLRSVSIAGSGDVQVAAFKTASVDASIGGSGNMRFSRIDAEHLSFDVAGSGTVTAAGRATSVKASIAGSGDIKASELVADAVQVSVAGSGDMQINAVKTLDASIAGSGSIAYLGSPQVSSSVAGSGRVSKLK